MSYESQKSTFSGLQCVEIVRYESNQEKYVAIFDSNLEGNGGARVVTEDVFEEFAAKARIGEVASTAILPNEGKGFTEPELTAWDLGIKAGEFCLASEVQQAA